MLNACKKCRTEGVKLVIKGERCLSPKCAVVRRSYGPGEHGQGGFSKVSEYGKQLREKQKAKRIYGLREGQFANYAKTASLMTGSKTENLLRLLELRLDNLVYRAGLAPSRSAARQIVNHGHILVNGKKVSIPSYRLKVGDVVIPKNADRFKELSLNSNIGWVSVDAKKITATVNSLPTREQIDTPVNESLVIEYYSR